MTGALALVAWLALGQADSSRTTTLDQFEDITPWSAHPADGVSLTLHSDSGHRGRALRMDFSFASGGGYAIARRALPLTLPSNYVFTLWIRGDAPPNTLEFKLLDGSGENVWWYTERDRRFDGSWQRITIRKRQIGFAWGPQGGGELGRMAALEIVITAGSGGGSGSVWIDDLALTEQPVITPYDGTPTVTSPVAAPGHPAGAIVDGDTATSWRSDAGGAVNLTVDFGRAREFGGVTLLWEPDRAASEYDVLLSDDGRAWNLVRQVRGGNGGRDHLYLPDGEARFLQLSLRRADGPAGYGLADLVIRPIEFGESRNAFFETIAGESAPGSFPRYYLGERAYWTVIGAEGAPEEGLINEDGAVDAGAGAFSVEPFLYLDSSLVTWRDVKARVGLEQGDLPIPSVEWTAPDLSLTVTGFATGGADRSSLVLRYRVHNRGSSARPVVLYLAVRPFQVNPPWQFLGVPGGAARIDSLRWTGAELQVNGDRRVIPLVEPADAGVSSFDGGEIVEYLRRGQIPRPRVARDPSGAASAGLAFPLRLGVGDSAEVAVEIPLRPGGESALPSRDVAAARTAMAAASRRWREIVDRGTVTLPGSGDAIARTIRSTIAWILVNRDRAAIQPGSRSYERSWIRDGALTSAALMRFGHADVVREFIDWYAGFLYPNGKVPCCVDRRGADPVPEHDSHGEFVYLVMEYWRHTGDRSLLERMWPKISGVVGYIDSLRQTLRTAEYRTPDKQVFFGLLPPSISHEGYSAKPMHSYWDDFFALRGLKDAAQMAQALGHRGEATRIGGIRDEFRRDLLASIQRAMRRHRIEFIPGSADLGDYDPTSTTIAVSPGGEESNLPRAALEHTFDRYWREVSTRRDSTLAWDAYTPYELRSVGTLLRLGRKDRALSLLTMFLGDREPPEWNQWPEVVWRDRRADKFIGDSPHTWVGSDFLRSAADLFVYEREADSALVVGAGIAEEWLTGEGVRVRGLSTWWGSLTYQVRLEGSTVRLRFEPGLRLPPGGLVVKSPGAVVPRQVRVDGREMRPTAAGEVILRVLPTELVFVR